MKNNIIERYILTHKDIVDHEVEFFYSNQLICTAYKFPTMNRDIVELQYQSVCFTRSKFDAYVVDLDIMKINFITMIDHVLKQCKERITGRVIIMYEYYEEFGVPFFGISVSGAHK